MKSSQKLGLNKNSWIEYTKKMKESLLENVQRQETSAIK